MPVVVVIIIVAAWAVILGPSLFKRRARTGGDQSISHFHYQLRVLEHRAPEPIVAPAYRLRAVDGSGTPTSIHYPDTGRPPVLTVVGAKELPRPALAFLGEPEVSEPVAADQPTSSPGRGVGLDADPYREPTATDPALVVASGSAMAPTPRGPDARTRAQARRRRQDTLTILGAVFIVTLMAAVLTGSAFVWAVVALDGVALGAYVGVLVHLRRMAAERDMKLHYLDPRTARPDRTEVQRTYMSGRYAHPSNQQAIAR
ncbi:MAG TPA: hypothetical protein VF279_00975 [Acidimicrobiales bacterium]